jgi:hypothetical protein
MGRLEGQKGVVNRVKVSVGPLFDRARMLRRDAARLVRQLVKTSEEISALTKPSGSLPPREKESARSNQATKEKPR